MASSRNIPGQRKLLPSSTWRPAEQVEKSCCFKQAIATHGWCDRMWRGQCGHLLPSSPRRCFRAG
ncbi:unnamed protein product [Ixodes hexagonus]